MFALAALLAMTQTPAPSKASLVSAMKYVAPGSTFTVALRLQLKPGWHVYWRNPGESGVPPTLDWKLPTGWKASDIQWPVPHREVKSSILNFVYDGDVLLPVRVTVPKSAKMGQRYTLTANAKWLVCRESCLVGKAPVSVTVIPSGSPTSNGTWAKRLSDLTAQLPRPVPDYPPRAWTDGKRIGLSLAPQPAMNDPMTGMTFYPADDVVDPSAPQPLRHIDGRNELLLTISSYAPSKIERLKGLLVAPPGTTWAPGLKAIEVDIPLQRRKP